MFSIFFLTFLTSAQLYNPATTTLGPNLILNPNFADPDINGHRSKKMAKAIPGWNDKGYQLNTINTTCSAVGITCANNYSQALEIDDRYVAWQTVNVPAAGTYLLSIEWMPSIDVPIGKNLWTKVNGSWTGNITCDASNAVYTYQKVEFLVALGAGTVNYEMSMYMTSGGSARNNGIFVAGVYLQMLVGYNGTVSNNANAINATNTTNNTTNSTNTTTNSTNTTTDSTSNTNSALLPPAVPLPNSSVPTSTSIISAPSSLAQIQNLVFHNLTGTLNKLPGNRVFLHTLTNFMLTFDRLQFYYYHSQNLTNNSRTLLKDINELANNRSQLVQGLLQSCQFQPCTSYNSVYEFMSENLNQQYNYSDSFVLERNPNGLGFFANNLDFFFYQLPFSLMIYALLYGFFRLFFNYRVSKYFRKYAFSGVFLYIMYEGNVEQFAFFFFSECKNLFSANLSHKMANVLMIYFFFLLIVFSIGGLLWFYYHYRKLCKYFLEESKENNMEAVIIESLERSVFPLVFGCVHALFLDNLPLQTGILFAVEALYFTAKCFSLRSKTPDSKFKIVFLTVTSLCRIAFIISFYLYESTHQPQVIDTVHYQLVWVYLLSWLAEFIHDCLVACWEVCTAVGRNVCRREDESGKSGKSEKGDDKDQGQSFLKVRDGKVISRTHGASKFKKTNNTECNITMTKKVRIATEEDLLFKSPRPPLQPISNLIKVEQLSNLDDHLDPSTVKHRIQLTATAKNIRKYD